LGALFAGALTGIVLSIGTDMLLRTAGVLPPPGRPMGDGLFLLATAYRTVYGIAGSYLAARLAPYRPMAHALLLGVVGTAVCILGAVVTCGTTDRSLGLTGTPSPSSLWGCRNPGSAASSANCSCPPELTGDAVAGSPVAPIPVAIPL
jgi:hypothetical protein